MTYDRRAAETPEEAADRVRERNEEIRQSLKDLSEEFIEFQKKVETETGFHWKIQGYRDDPARKQWAEALKKYLTEMVTYHDHQWDHLAELAKHLTTKGPVQ